MRKFYKIIIEYYFKIFKSGVSYAKYKGVNIGVNCRIYTTKFGSEPWLITIGNKVTITSGVVLLTHDGSTWLMNDEKGRRYLYRRILIGDNVFIGVNSIILPGVKIGHNVIIAAGSVVTKSIPSGKIVAGNPAKIIGEFNNYKLKVLSNYVSDLDIDLLLPYRERIEKVVNTEYKENIE